MIDLHCHILPGVDDGPATRAQALEMARTAVAAGTRTIVATPHVDERWGAQPRTIGPAVDALRAALAAHDIPLDVRAGAEVSISRWMRLSADDRAHVALGGGPFVLVEMPHAEGIVGFERALHAGLARGERLVLAHPERCPAFQRRPETLLALVGDGAVTSVTAGAFAGRFGTSVQRFALDLMGAGVVHSVASDSHDTRRRPPEIAPGLDACEATLPQASRLREWLTVAVPRAVLDGTRIPARPGEGRMTEID